MKNKELFYGVVGLLSGILLTFLFVTNVVNSNNYGMMQMMGLHQRAERSEITSNIDGHFIEHMIPHHEGAIEMAKLAQEKSKRPEILKLASNIIESQSVEIAQMKAWYQEWYGKAVPVDVSAGKGMGRGMMHGGMTGGETSDIDALKNASDFDTAFLEEMIPHHEMAVVMAEMLLSGTSRSEMKQLAKDIIDAQEAEIELMQSWLRK